MADAAGPRPRGPAHERMASWFDPRTIRTRLVLLVLLLLLPFAAALVWFLAADVQQARDAARGQVGTLAGRTAAELQRLLERSEALLEHLASRPQVRALDRAACGLFVAEDMLYAPEVLAIAVRGSDGALVCAYWPRPRKGAVPDTPSWAAADLPGGDRFAASPIIGAPGGGRPLTLLSVPVRDPAGLRIGSLQLAIDLLALNRQLFASMPDRAVVTVVDPARAVLLRSAEPERFIGQRPGLDAPDPAHGAREGYLEVDGRDGVPRLFAFLTLPGVDWRVAASLPASEVYSQYRTTLRNTIAIGAGLGLLALVLAWRLGAAIAGPITALRRVAARVAAGDTGIRSPVTGPAEIRAVALAFNHMLDQREHSESRLRGIFDSAVDAIVTADENQVIVEANPAAASMFRLPLEQMIGAPLERFIPAHRREQHRHDMHVFGAGAQGPRHMGAQRDVVALRADGQEFPIEASISQLTLSGRRLYTVIHRDVSERRAAETALRDSEARLRRLLTYLPDAVFVHSGNRIVFVNQAARRLFGADDAALLGRSPLEFIDAGSRAKVEARIAALSSDAPVAPLVDVRIRRSDGVTREVESLGTLIEHDGDRSILVVMRDVTELQLVRSALAASHADLMRLVSALDSIQEEERKRIARELHDDLQQTLAAISLDAASIGAELKGGMDHVLPLLARINGLAAAAIASTRRIINDLRPQMLEDLGLPAALEALAAGFERRTGIRCEVDVGGEPFDDTRLAPRLAMCLYRVAQEALNNVARHARAGAVQLRLSDGDGATLRLRVADDGIGFAADDLRKPQSFGLLGMQERVRAVGGTLRMATAPGGGTVLEVEAPMAAGGSVLLQPQLQPGTQQPDGGEQRQQHGGGDEQQLHQRT